MTKSLVLSPDEVDSYEEIRELVANKPRQEVTDDGLVEVEPDHTITVYVDNFEKQTLYRAAVRAARFLRPKLDQRFKDGIDPRQRKLTCLRISPDEKNGQKVVHCGFWSEDQLIITLN